MRIAKHRLMRILKALDEIEPYFDELWALARKQNKHRAFNAAHDLNSALFQIRLNVNAPLRRPLGAKHPKNERKPT